jgi:hypothetical protein
MSNAAEKRDDEPVTRIPQMPDPTKALAAIENRSPEIDAPAPSDPKAAEQYEFVVSVKDGAGKVWSGTFKNRILTIEDRVNVGLTQATLVSGIPWSSLDPETQALTEVMAHLAKSLVDKPRWFVLSGPDAIRNTRILNAVFREVTAHEAFFRGSDSPAP